MSSDYSPHTRPPIIHRDELGALRRPPAPDGDVSPHLPAAQELMAQARKQGAPELWLAPFPAGWVVTCEAGYWLAELRPPLALTLLEEELGYDRVIERPTRGDLLAAVQAREAIRSAT